MLSLSKRNAVHRIEKLGKEIFQDDGISCNYFDKPRKYDAATSITDDAYDKSFTEKRIFKMEKKPKDPVKIFMNTHEDAKEMYFKAPTAVEQDRCIAAIALKLHPEWLEQYPALQHMDLSYENVITKPYREMKEREERAFHADEERINKVLKEKSVKVPEKKHYDEKDLNGLSRAE